MSIPRLLDHVIIAGPDLDQLVDRFHTLTGVTATPGGAHPTGTANALIALTVDGKRGPHYVELIGPDPTRPGKEAPTTFGIDRLDGPRLVTYAVHPEGIDQVVEQARAEGYDPGDVQDLSRRTPDGTLLQWRLSRGPQPRRQDVPFLIDWGKTPNPGLGELPTLELLSLVRIEPDPEPLHLLTEALGLDDGVAEIREGEGSRFALRLRTAQGREVEISDP